MTDVNQLRRLLAAGQITDQDIAGMRLSGQIDTPTFHAAIAPPQNALAKALSPQEAFAQGGEQGDLPMGSMRNETTGKVTYFQPNAQAPRTAQDPGFSDTPYPAQPAQALPRYRVAGYGGGQFTDLGEDQGALPPVDMSRGPVDIPGAGRGYYTRDGRSAIVTNPDGTKTKVLLGYDADASERRNDAALKRQRAMAELAQTNAAIEHTNEATMASREARTRKDAASSIANAGGLVPQKVLEEAYGKPDAGMRWKSDGTQEPLPGGTLQQSNKSALDAAREAIGNIDALIGQRDSQGNLVAGSKPHAGFESAVGVSVPKALGAGFIPGTDTKDFQVRLDQLRGGAFLQAFNTLKGGGAITEVEGKKATDAITRMNTAQSEAEFVKAAQEFRAVLQRGAEKAAGLSGQPAAQAPQESGRRFAMLPDARAFAGKIAVGDDGARYQSDGTRWVRQ